MSLRTAMILAAGRGSRLAPLTDDIPKPLLDIGGQPLLAHQLEWLRAGGIERVVINVFHLGEQITTAIGDGRQFGLEVHYSREPQLLETGGGIRLAADFLGSEPFVLLNGDIWTDYPFAQLPQSLPPALLGHLVLTPTPAHRAEGDFGFAHRRVNRHSRDYVYCAFGVLRTAILGDRTGVFSLREPLFDAAAAGALAGEVWPGEWTDIGSLAQLHAVRDVVAARAS